MLYYPLYCHVWTVHGLYCGLFMDRMGTHAHGRQVTTLLRMSKSRHTVI